MISERNGVGRDVNDFVVRPRKVNGSSESATETVQVTFQEPLESK